MGATIEAVPASVAGTFMEPGTSSLASSDLDSIVSASRNSPSEISPSSHPSAVSLAQSGISESCSSCARTTNACAASMTASVTAATTTITGPGISWCMVNIRVLWL